MKNCRIAAVISFCTHDYRFLRKCLEEVAAFSDQIVVTCCDHFFNGDPEDYALLEAAYRAFPTVVFLEFAFNPKERYGDFCTLEPAAVDQGHHWHSVGRFISYYFINESITHFFFFDVDEIAEGKRFSSWLLQNDLEPYSALRFATHLYFREARYRAAAVPDSPLLVNRAHLQPEMLLDLDERMGLFWALPGDKKLNVRDEEGNPFIHHYSFVRPKEEMLQKVKRWGHHWERDWNKLIEEEFSRDFNGCDFVFGHSYTAVDPFFDPLKEPIPQSTEQISLDEHERCLPQFPNVTKLFPRDILRKDLEIKFQL